MRRIKKIVCCILKVLGAGIVAVGALSVFVMSYQYSGTHIDNETGATDYKWEKGQYKATMEEGFSWLRMDDNGFNNAFCSSKKTPDIILMGSSHMEALQVKSDENVAYQLNVLQPDYYTYNIGMSGHTIYRCISNIEDAMATYHPNKYVVIETDNIELSMGEMQAVIDENDIKIPSYDAGIIYYLQKIPALKWLYKNIGIWTSNSDIFCVKAEGVDDFISAEYEEILDKFLEKAKNEMAGVELIIFYHPREILKEDGSVSYIVNQEYLHSFEKVCKRQQIIFIDMSGEFAKLYQEKNILAHGFCNTEIGVGHLNKYGHQAIAEKLSEVIAEMEAK